MNYKEKLLQFNSTEKYLKELHILNSLCDLTGNQKALDYGCGTGCAMKFINQRTGCEVFGYDIADNLYDGDPFYFRKELFFQVDCVYFMHSLAHIKYPELKLEKVKGLFLKKGGRLVIITPNADWLKLQNNKEYIPDTTVIKHYGLQELIDMVTDAGFTFNAAGQVGDCTNGIHERIFIKAIS